jgi:hypothetical protein
MLAEITIPKFKVAVENAEMTVPKFKVAVENTVYEPNPITFEKRGEALMTREAFLDSFTDSSIYCDLDVRPKTAKALIKFSERIPDKIVNDLPRIVVFAPNPDAYGSCLPLMPSDSTGGGAFIYLAPSLERQSQTEVDFTVAHEFSHAALRHHEPKNLMSLSMEEAKKAYLNWNSEVAADQLVAEWGYEIPTRRKRER